jgi:hypothetical protein
MWSQRRCAIGSAAKKAPEFFGDALSIAPEIGYREVLFGRAQTVSLEFSSVAPEFSSEKINMVMTSW